MSDHNCYNYSDQNGTYCIKYDEIIWIEAIDNYVRIHSIDEKEEIVISKTLKLVTKELEGKDQFFRIHRSHLINGKYFRSFRKKDGGIVLLKNGKELLVSRRRRKEFLLFIKQL